MFQFSDNLMSQEYRVLDLTQKSEKVMEEMNNILRNRPYEAFTMGELVRAAMIKLDYDESDIDLPYILRWFKVSR